MGTLAKREFCKKYATKKINTISKERPPLLVFVQRRPKDWAFYKTYSMVIHVGLVMALFLGIHLVKSGICVILLVLYGFANSIFMFISTGKLQGWWLILAGLLAIQATFHLHNVYRLFLVKDILPQKVPPPLSPFYSAKSKAAGRTTQG